MVEMFWTQKEQVLVVMTQGYVGGQLSLSLSLLTRQCFRQTILAPLTVLVKAENFINKRHE